MIQLSSSLEFLKAEKRESRSSLLTTVMPSESMCIYVVIHMDPVTNCVMYLLLWLYELCSVSYYCHRPLGLCCYAKMLLVSSRKNAQYRSMTNKYERTVMLGVSTLDIHNLNIFHSKLKPVLDIYVNSSCYLYIWPENFIVIHESFIWPNHCKGSCSLLLPVEAHILSKGNICVLCWWQIDIGADIFQRLWFSPPTFCSTSVPFLSGVLWTHFQLLYQGTLNPETICYPLKCTDKWPSMSYAYLFVYNVRI